MLQPVFVPATGMVNAYMAEYGSTGPGCQSCSWSDEQIFFLIPWPRSRRRLGSHETGLAVPSRVSLLILHTQTEPGAYSRDSSRFPQQHPTAFGSVPSLSGQTIAYRWRSLSRIRRHRASSPQGSSSNGCCFFRYCLGPIFKRLFSFTTPTNGTVSGHER